MTRVLSRGDRERLLAHAPLATAGLARRPLLKALGLGALASALGVRVPAAEAQAPRAGKRRKTLVVVFQRGAADGLSMVPPVGDKRYYELRPTIAVPAPGAPGGALKLDGTFGLHPALAALAPHWASGALALVHGVGSPDETRSHFDAQDYAESGTPGVKHTEDGFLNRLLRAAPEKGATDLRAIALQPNVPRMLAGPEPAVAFSSLEQFRVQRGNLPADLTGDFEKMYDSAVDAALRGTSNEAFSAVRALKAIKGDSFPPAHGAVYPPSPLGKRFRQIAQIIQADLGVELVVTDCGGWDTHVGEAGLLPKSLGDLGGCLGAFATDLTERLGDVCVVTLTEFGRTARENGTGGTDHGHGSVMMVLGGNVRGRKVYGTWKGLADDALHEKRDLPVTTDHRDVFGEVLRAHLGQKDLGLVFPGYTPPAATRLGLFG